MWIQDGQLLSLWVRITIEVKVLPSVYPVPSINDFVHWLSHFLMSLSIHQDPEQCQGSLLHKMENKDNGTLNWHYTPEIWLKILHQHLLKQTTNWQTILQCVQHLPDPLLVHFIVWRCGVLLCMGIEGLDPWSSLDVDKDDSQMMIKVFGCFCSISSPLALAHPVLLWFTLPYLGTRVK